MNPQHLHLDFETFSLLDLKVVGIDNYAKHSSTGISCLGWALDDEEVEVWLPHKGPMPAKLRDALATPSIIKIAWNASFEYNITNRIAGPRYITPEFYVPMGQFRDPMVLAHNLSLPGKLEKVAIILKMQNLKDERGKELMKMFCNPVSMGGEQTLFGISQPLFRDHNSHPREFAEYVEYCKQDVRAERDLWYKLSKIGFPEHEWRGWLLDQKINEFGIPVRRDLAEKGLRLALRYIKEQKDLCKKLTGLANPNSDVQMKAWAKERGYELNSLLAPTVEAEINRVDSKMTPECKIALKARGLARKSSHTKIVTLLELLSTIDDRIRYQLRFMGAPRTGRWASGGGEDASMQVQNLARGAKLVKKNLERALQLLEAEDYDGIIKEFTNTPNPKDSVSVVAFVITLLRSLFQAKPGKVFHVADKNAIENRMLGWAAGCEAILDVFRKGRDPYMAFGVYLYNIPYEEWYIVDAAGNHKPKNADFEEKRQQSKAPVLGGGYGLGGGELYIDEHGDEKRGGMWGYALSVCGVDMPKDLAHKAVKILRDAWPEVVVFWGDLEEAFKQVFIRGGCVKVGEVTWDKQAREWVEHPTKGKGCVLTFRRIKMDDGRFTIRIELPSGRALHYLNVSLDEETRTSKKTGRPYTVETIHYDGIEHSATQGADGKTTKKKHKWGRVKTYGGKICENVIQAMSRDDLLHSMMLADEMGFHIVATFHDEVLCEEEDVWDGLRLDDLLYCMKVVPGWSPGLMLGAEGFSGKVYRKG